MHILFAYSSRHGTTRKAGELLQSSWNDHLVHFCDLQLTPLPDVRPFDAVIIGGSIHAGFIQPEIRRLCESRHDLLLSRTLGLFMCYMDEKRATENFEKAFPKFLRDHASAKGFFGGELVFERMSWLDTLIVSRFTHFKSNVSLLKHDEIQQFAIHINRAINLSQTG